MVTGNSNEIWLIFASFDADYVGWVTGERASLTTAKKSFLLMQRIGTAHIRTASQMRSLLVATNNGIHLAGD